MEMIVGRTALRLAAALFLAASSLVSAGDPLLILRSDGPKFEETVRGMTDDFSGAFDVSQLVVTKETTADMVKDEIAKVAPKIVILMDNTAIRLFGGVQSHQTDTSAYLPSVSLMAASLDISTLKNATGIQYEIPIVTSVVNLRAVLGKPIAKVGVIYRKSKLGDFIEKSREFCASENIQIVDAVAPDDGEGMDKFVADALKDMVKNKGVEAVWVPLDIALLKPDVLQKGWMPAVKSLKIPLVVASENLVNPALGFFGVLPDHVALGAQAAGMIYDIRDNNWLVSASGSCDPPLSVYKVVSGELASKMFKVSEENLQNVDKTVK